MANNTLTRWDPFREMMTLRDAMDRLFEESFIWPSSSYNRDVRGYSSLPIDLYETKDELIVHAFLPGLKVENVNLQLHNGNLTIDANMPEREINDATIHYRELTYGNLHREIALPVAVDENKVDAVMENGYLTLRLPKAEEFKPKQIQIKAKR